MTKGILGPGCWTSSWDLDWSADVFSESEVPGCRHETQLAGQVPRSSCIRTRVSAAVPSPRTFGGGLGDNGDVRVGFACVEGEVHLENMLGSLLDLHTRATNDLLSSHSKGLSDLVRNGDAWIRTLLLENHMLRGQLGDRKSAGGVEMTTTENVFEPCVQDTDACDGSSVGSIPPTNSPMAAPVGHKSSTHSNCSKRGFSLSRGLTSAASLLTGRSSDNTRQSRWSIFEDRVVRKMPGQGRSPASEKRNRARKENINREYRDVVEKVASTRRAVWPSRCFLRIPGPECYSSRARSLTESRWFRGLVLAHHWEGEGFSVMWTPAHIERSPCSRNCFCQA